MRQAQACGDERLGRCGDVTLAADRGLGAVRLPHLGGGELVELAGARSVPILGLVLVEANRVAGHRGNLHLVDNIIIYNLAAVVQHLLMVFVDTMGPVTDVTQADLTRTARIYGSRLAVNPYRALLEEVQWRAGHVAWLRDELDRRGYDGLVQLNVDGEELPSIWLKRYDEERRHLDRACKLAIDAGIAERYVQLAELQGQVLHRALRGALEATATELAWGPDELERFAGVFGAAFRRALEAESQPRVLAPALPAG